LIFDQSGVYSLKRVQPWFFALNIQKANSVTSHIVVVLKRYLPSDEDIEPNTAVYLYRAPSKAWLTPAGAPVPPGAFYHYAPNAKVADDFFAAHLEKTLVDTNGKLGTDWHVQYGTSENTWKSAPQISVASPNSSVETSFIEQLGLDPKTCKKAITSWLFPDAMPGGRAIFSMYYNNAKGAYLWISKPDDPAFEKHYFLNFTQ
jgi:hypothetical protein